MLYLVGLGLKAKNLTLEGLDTIKKSKHIFYEEYTSIIDWINELEKICGKEFKKLERSDLEEDSDQIIDLASYADLVILVSGDPLAATTHQALLTEAKQKGIPTRIIHAPSILTAVGETGLWLYKFGRTVTIPKKGKLNSVKKYIQNNQKIGLHTLILLDVGMTAAEGINRLLKSDIITPDTTLITCSRLGRKNSKIIKKTAKELKAEKINQHPQCLILPGEVHEMEKI